MFDRFRKAKDASADPSSVDHRGLVALALVAMQSAMLDQAARTVGR